MFASRTKKVVIIEDVQVTIQKLSARSLDNASEARQIAVGKVTRQLGSEIMRTLRELPDRVPEKEPTAEEKQKARFTSYDRDYVLTAGIASWTATHPDGLPLSLTDGIPDLEESAATMLFESILELSLPNAEVVGKD